MKKKNHQKKKVNVYLTIEIKKYIKTISCYPDQVSQSLFDGLGHLLDASEKVHIALLAIESARQSALLYGLHAVFLAAAK